MLPTTITTEELRRLTGYAKSSIVALEQEGVIARTAKDTWAIETVPTLIAHLRERKPVVSTDRSRFEKARAEREELKAKKLAGELCPVSEFHDCWVLMFGAILSRLVALPARCTRDLALRKRIEEEVNNLRHEVSDEFQRRADELGGGKAA